MQPFICKLESDTQVDVRCCSPCEGLQLLLAQRCQLQQLLLLVHCHSLLEPSQDALQTRSTSLSNITTATWPHVPGMHVPLETGLWLLGGDLPCVHPGRVEAGAHISVCKHDHTVQIR
jgi:hypothetical protein